MRKKIKGFALFTGMALSLGSIFSQGMTARAETLSSEWNVAFTADNKMDTDYTAADLNAAVYSMQPGDSMLITLNLSNANASASNWYMKNEIIQSLEETAGASASGGAYEYELTYTDPAGATEILFTSTTVGGETTGDRVGLHGATSGLEDYFYLDTLENGQKGVITLRVELDGETQGNNYQNTLASLQMQFAVDTTVSYDRTVTEVVEDQDPGDGTGNTGDPGTDGNGSGGGNRTNIVKTGDESNLTPYIIAAAASGILLLILAVYGVRERRKAKKGGAKALGMLLALCMIFSMSGRVSAGNYDQYTYTVRLFAGAQGTIDGDRVCRIQGQTIPGSSGAVYEIKGLHYGEQITFNVQNGVTVGADSKYYVRGIRQSGEDNSTVGNLSFTVTGDQDYVVAYGIKGDTVAYTVNYLDESGNALAPSETYYGNVGDKPVVAYQYIEGYQPQAYNLGKTLSADVSENVFSFIYTPIPVNVRVDYVTVPGQPQPPAVQPEVPEEPQPGIPVIGPEPEPEPVVPIPDDELPQAPPEEYVDLDDPEVPQAGGDKQNGDKDDNKDALVDIMDDFVTPLASMPVGGKVTMIAGLITLAGVIVWFLVFHKKRKKEDEE